jgi:uncharacterized protein (DUF952 family)
MQAVEPLYHVAVAAEFDAAGDDYEPAGFLDSGFVHCCSLAQLGGVLSRHFAGAQGLLLLEVDPAEVVAEIRWEYVAAANDTFAHVYGPIPKRAVRSAMPIEPEVEITAADLTNLNTDEARRLLADDE